MIFPLILTLLLTVEGAKGIVSVKQVAVGSAQYMVSLQNLQDKHVCAGAIINARYVLTAGHCVHGKKREDFKIVANSINLKDRKNLQKHDIKKFHIHPDFAPDATAPVPKPKHDLAVVELMAPLTVKPPALRYTGKIRVAEDAPEYGVRCIFTGWGAMNPDHLEWTTSRGTLIQLQVKHSPFCSSVCCAEPGTLCVQDEEKLAAPCNGDDGGPLNCHGVLAGIASVPHCNPKALSRFVNVAESAKWIDSIVKSSL